MTSTDDLGVLTEHGDTWQLTFTRLFAHPPEKVWRALTEPEHRAVWFPDTVEGEFAAGAKLRFVTSQDPPDGFDGEMVVFDPPRTMELLWGADRLRFELEAIGAGTRMTFTDTFAELGKAARDGAGWHECLQRLADELEGTTPSEWSVTWRAVHPRYVDRLGPEAATIGPPEGWDATA
jgi:uncharacterized protein YndB with AHSA1/START domain